MNMIVLPSAMWCIFQRSFKSNLDILGVSNPDIIMCQAKQKYKEIINIIPPFGKNDILLVNILSSATVAAIYMSLPKRVSLEQVEEFYRCSMNDNSIMNIFLKNTKNFTVHYQNSLKKDAEKIVYN